MVRRKEDTAGTPEEEFSLARSLNSAKKDAARGDSGERIVELKSGLVFSEFAGLSALDLDPSGTKSRPEAKSHFY
jgi:hypothetical protein